MRQNPFQSEPLLLELARLGIGKGIDVKAIGYLNSPVLLFSETKQHPIDSRVWLVQCASAEKVYKDQMSMRFSYEVNTLAYNNDGVVT